MNLAQHKRSEKPKPIRLARELRREVVLFYYDEFKDREEMDVIEDVNQVSGMVNVVLEGGGLAQFELDDPVDAFRFLPLGSNET